MNIAELSIRKATITWVMTAVLVVVGWLAFQSLPRLEDPEFTIKEAIVVTPYPGASAAEVEEEVTNVIEKAVQELGQLRYVESRSSRGLSSIKVVINDKYDKAALPQVWDELRRKVGDYQKQLPPGAGPSVVNDDYGDVFGVYLAITGGGYEPRELYNLAKFLQRELLGATDVKKIVLYGQRKEAVYVEMRREKMAELGVSQQEIFDALKAKNLPVTAGHVFLGAEYVTVNPTGEFRSEKEFGDLLIGRSGKGGGRLVYLRDVARIRRGYTEPPDNLLRYDGKPAVGLAISTVSGGNVVTMGASLKEKFQDLQSQIPLGVELHTVSMQPDAVTTAIDGFLVNLAEAVVIVVVVLLVFMGLRSGLIIGFVLLLTILGTFVFMGMGPITLERISLGALVIALGMLVDNAIVVTDGMRMKMKQGADALTAAREVVGQTGIPLLGATFIAIAAFASIGTSQDGTGEYCRALFSVIFISLTLSWVTAVTATPLLCKTFLKTDAGGGKDDGLDPYGGKFFLLYKGALASCIRHRWVTMGVVVALFAASVVGFGRVKQSFFPDSTRPQFYVDYWFPDGTSIEETSRRIGDIEQWLLEQEGVEHVTTEVGGGQPRFLLTYTPEAPFRNFGRTLVDVADYRQIPAMIQQIQAGLEDRLPETVVNARMFVNGPSSGGKIQLRIYGPDTEELRRLGDTALDIIRSDPGSRGVRSEWGNKVKVVRPVLAEAQARRAGITRPMLAKALEAAVEGTRAGVYRERDELLPIIARAPAPERSDLANLGAVQVWSPVAGRMIPVGQVVDGFEVAFENPHIWRRDRTKMLKIHADPRTGLPSELFARIKARVEQELGVDVAAVTGRDVSSEAWTASTIRVRYLDRLPLEGRPGYYMAWGGEAEDSAKSQSALSFYIQVFFGLMVLMVVWLFNSLKKTAIIWLTVPLALIGVTLGLLLLRQPFGFMSLLGLMSLAGMLIKNAIVLIDQIDLELSQGKPGFQAIVDSGASRMIPVSMAALTTILGMIPLVKDAFFVSMAVTIMFGLGFATILTLFVVPVLYAIFFRVEADA